ncbi:MAG: EAL domain-containing protein [Candidatus Dormibacteraeota bacterium]|uniref:EAL domain-containing protein n=1 Tax=Candidatus Amunia macphersoniae TaxID=3127014 RepID=A0A934KN25_9BACT|nr:EAL domain-containing protein [Candidatus Dormibacteraeota bacterium]
MTQGENTPGDTALTALALEQPLRLLVDDILEAAREYLDMDVAFVAEFAGGEQIFRHVAGDAAVFRLSSELRVPLGWMYCKDMTDGRLAEAIPDVAADPLASAMAVTMEAHVGSYVGVPVSLPDGRVWGSMACLSRRADHSVGKRDVRFMRMLARIYAEQLEREEREAVARRQKRAQIRAILREGRLITVLQPIVDLLSGAAVGFEALARFEGETPQPPDLWFAAAKEVGLGRELELAAVRSALGHLADLPDDAYLSLNISPETAVSAEFAALMERGTDRVVIEVTEHAAIGDYPQFNSSVARLRFRGMRYAVDDAGAGFATFSHILSTKPDIVKLDMSLIRDIHRDLARRALLHGLIYFIEQINATAVAEGIETQEEAEALKRLGVHCAQGYFFGRPGEQLRQPSPVRADDRGRGRVRVLPLAK